MPSAADLATLLATLPPPQRAALLDANRAGLDRMLGLRYEVAEDDRVVATLEVRSEHLQPYGLVHGGVYAAMVESVCSVGAALNELPKGRNVVGLENTTRFHRGTRLGAQLRVEATPSAEPHEGAPNRARWDATITDAAGEVRASGCLVVAILAPDATVGGAPVALPSVEVPSDD